MPQSPTPPVSSNRVWPKRLLTLGAIYFLWLVWLGYVAWVNIQSGNQ